MKKSKLSVVALVISLLPFITLLISLFSGKITGGLQMGLTALNVISILLGLGLSISVVKNPKRRDVFQLLLYVFVAFGGYLWLVF